MSESTPSNDVEQTPKQSPIDAAKSRKGFRNSKKPSKAVVAKENDALRLELANVKTQLVTIGRTSQFLGQQVMQLTTKSTTLADELQAMAGLLRFERVTDAAIDGDRVLIDCVGRLVNDDGTPGKLFNGSRLDTSLITIGDKKFVPGFEDKLLGMKLGEVKSITVTFPENYAEELKGKKAVFETIVLATFRAANHDNIIRNLADSYIAKEESEKALVEAKAKEKLDASIQETKEVSERVAEESQASAGDAVDNVQEAKAVLD